METWFIQTKKALFIGSLFAEHVSSSTFGHVGLVFFLEKLLDAALSASFLFFLKCLFLYMSVYIILIDNPCFISATIGWG